MDKRKVYVLVQNETVQMISEETYLELSEEERKNYKPLELLNG